MRLGIVTHQIITQPEIGFRLVLRGMEMVERFVRFFDGPERPLDLAFRSRGDAPPVRPRGMCVRTSTPSCAITRRKVADFATGPLSR